MYCPVSVMKLRHSKQSSDEIEPSAEGISEPASSGGADWKCPSCGAMNEDFRKFCDGCGDKRPGVAVASKGISMDEILGTSSSASASSDDDSSTFEDNSSKRAKGKKNKKNKKSDEDDDTREPERLAPAQAEAEPFQSSTAATGDFESKPSDDFGASPSFVVSGPEPSPSSDDSSSPSSASTFYDSSSSSSASSFSSYEPTPAPSPTSSSSTTGSDQRYYLVFVNTPASSLIKTRVAIEFGDFPTVSIGRSPENVIVIPDPEVSRKHASLSFDGNRLVLKDLGSSNGSFIYNGKDFQRVSDSVEVRPNTVLKFGTGTIVKLVSE
jgi:FHA domain